MTCPHVPASPPVVPGLTAAHGTAFDTSFVNGEENEWAQPLRIMTYNVHGCVGCDKRLDHSRIAEVIAGEGPDIVALQELDVARERSGRAHQARIIAELLNMRFHFHPALRMKEEEEYGDAILSKWPMHLVQAAELPTVNERLAFEPRGAQWVAIHFDGCEIQVLNTHLGLSRNERHAQIETLLGPDWLKHPRCLNPRILCGDFNALPSSSLYRKVSGAFRDTQRAVTRLRPRPTFPSRCPLIRLDYIFTSDDLRCRDVRVIRTPLTRMASDHLPVVAELQLRVGARGTPVKSAT